MLVSIADVLSKDTGDVRGTRNLFPLRSRSCKKNQLADCKAIALILKSTPIPALMLQDYFPFQLSHDLHEVQNSNSEHCCCRNPLPWNEI